MEFQVTLFSTDGIYRPVSCIVRRKAPCDIKDPAIKRQILNEGMQKICNTRGWTARDLAKFGFKTGKVRVYDKEKLDKEAEERYNKIKEEKYASGEWKRPKKKRGE
jgi:hypothetical protein